MKKTVSLSLASILLLGAAAGVASADDMTAQEKFDALKAKGIFNGLNDDGFSGLDQNMTRAQFARVAGLLDGLDVDATPSSQTFKDVAPGNWAYEEVAAAAKAGLLIGNGDGTFNPNGQVTKEQMATVLTRILDIQVDDSAKVDGASDWAQKYVKAAVDAGVITGTDSFTAPVRRDQLVVSTYSTDLLQTTIQTVKDENKPAIGKLLALGVMEADGDQFGASKTMSKDDVLKALGAMTDDKLDPAGLNLPDNPTFADVLRAYLQALGYPADSLKDASKLVEKAVAAGVVDADSPLLKIQQLNVPMTREWGSYLTAGTLFNASTVTVDADGNVKADASKHLSQTMKLPTSPIKVTLKDIEGVPTYDSLNGIDPSINSRLTGSSGAGGSTVVDSTAPSVTAATINGKTVTVAGGANGSIGLKSSDYLTGGTISVDEASTLTITAIEGLTLGDYSSLTFTQSLTAGSNSLNLIDTLGALDPQDDGVAMSTLSQWDTNQDGLVISGTLSDARGNSRAVTLTISTDDVAPSITAASVNGTTLSVSGGSAATASLGASDFVTAGTITVDEDATLAVTAVGNANLASYGLSFTQQLSADTESSLDLIEFLGTLDTNGDGVSVSKLMTFGSPLTVTGTLSDAAGNSRTVTLTFASSNP